MPTVLGALKDPTYSKSSKVRTFLPPGTPSGALGLVGVSTGLGVTSMTLAGVVSPNHVLPSLHTCHWKPALPAAAGALRRDRNVYSSSGLTDVPCAIRM